jgi:hypothetical protein
MKIVHFWIVGFCLLTVGSFVAGCAVSQQNGSVGESSPPQQNGSVGESSPSSETIIESFLVPPWMDRSNWSCVQKGMSERQVLSILGKPTSIKPGVYRKLFYRGEVDGSGFVSGNIWLADDRVQIVNIPVF